MKKTTKELPRDEVLKISYENFEDILGSWLAAVGTCADNEEVTLNKMPVIGADGFVYLSVTIDKLRPRQLEFKFNVS